MSPPAAVHADALTKHFGDVVAVAGIDFEIETGEVYGVIGPNGAGKTTTMRMLLDILRPTSGTVRVLGEDPRIGGPALRKRIGYLPGELVLDARTDSMTLLEHFGRISGDGESGRIRELAERFALDPTRRIGELSKGNKQKVGVIQAFMHTPELLVLDEPTSGLDPLLQQEFLELIREARDQGQTVFLSSHVLSEIQHVADRVAILRQGEIITESNVETLRRQIGKLVTVTLERDVTDETLTAIAGVESVRHDGAASYIRVEGSPRALVEALVTYGIEDLLVEEPDLESAVLHLYDGGTSRNAPEEARR